MQFITRAEWGAQYSNGEPGVILPMRWQDVWLHHSVTTWLPPDATLEQEIAAVREIERIGQREFDQGMSYTRIIPASGRVFEGHGLDRRGAHTYRRNDSSRAICFIGNYEHDQPTPAQLRSAAAVVREWHASGYCPRPALSGGHRDVYATACPGKHAYAAIPEINQLATSGEPLNLEDDLSGQGDNLLAFIATGGPDTQASQPGAPAGAIDPTSLFGRVLQLEQDQAVIRDQVANLHAALMTGGSDVPTPLFKLIQDIAAKVGA